jgi:hypothetical protein
MKSLIHIGNTKEAVQEVTLSILGILDASHADEETKRAALKALSDTLGINNVSITNSTFNNTPKKGK